MGMRVSSLAILHLCQAKEETHQLALPWVCAVVRDVHEPVGGGAAVLSLQCRHSTSTHSCDRPHCSPATRAGGLRRDVK